jgi:hypothetical protein
MLERHSNELLHFVKDIDNSLEYIAEEYNVSLYYVREVYMLEGMSKKSYSRWQRGETVRKKLKWYFHPIQEAVCDVLSKVVRASSVVENLNSRLRNYFFLRKHLGNGYLGLLRFFLNHHPFARSENSQRKGKSPAELLMNSKHPHWLEILGFKMSTQAA